MYKILNVVLDEIIYEVKLVGVTSRYYKIMDTSSKKEYASCCAYEIGGCGSF